MNKTTFAQLPGLQKAARILELQEQINTHHLYATYLLYTFNDLKEFESAHYDDQAEKLQIICEWHGTQAMYLQCQLDELKHPS
jgi:hypothetical protein